MDINNLLRQSEGKTLEFKRDLSSPAGLLRTAIAFANTAGGTIVVGIEDVTKHIRGVKDVLPQEERLASLISDSILPKILPDIEILTYRDAQLLVVNIYPSPNRPHFLKRGGLDEGTYVRLGSSNRKADSDLIEEMKRFSRGQAFDEIPMPNLSSEAIDYRVASESFSEVRKLKRSDLKTLRLLTEYQGKSVPTIGGILLFGTERLKQFPDAWIQAGRFAGTDKSKLVDHIDLQMHLVDGIYAAAAFIEKHTRTGTDIGAVKRIENFALPPAVTREALINSVVHCDYSQHGAPIRLSIFIDRIEIENPGLLPFGLTIDDLHHGVSKLRNRVIGRVLNELGLVEQWGSGAQRMISICRENGLPEPCWEEIAGRLRVTLKTIPTIPASIDARDKLILDQITEHDGLSTSEIARAIGISPRATRSRLVKLVARNLVVEIGTGPRDPQRKYHRAQQ